MPRGLLSTLIYRVTVNHCLNQLRRKRIARFLPFDRPSAEDEAASFEPPDPRPGADVQLAARSRWRATRKAIATLPANQRAVLVLARFEELSYREIADVLGISLGAVESRLFRAMRNLEKAQEMTLRGVP